MNYIVEERKISTKEYQAIRATTNWGMLDDKVVEKALNNDLYSVCVTINGKLIGFGRIVGDGAIYFYVQDIIVLPEFRSKGVGRLIMENIEKYITANTNRNSFVGLMAAEGVINFYKKFRYRERPVNRPGMYKLIY